MSQKLNNIYCVWFFVVITLFVLNISTMSFSEQVIKKSNVSGQFYADDPKQLSADIDQFFKEADVTPYDQHVDIVIAPHAGYVYSGGVAAHGFKAVSRQKYSTIVILAPSHFFGFDGMSVWDQGGFQTPLGIVPVDQDFTKKLIQSHNKTSFIPQAFAREHSLEVEIPFLQKTFTNFKIVPVIMGQPDYSTLKDFAASLSQVMGGRDDVLVVVSTDFSHYHDDKKARSMDQQAVEAVKTFQIEKIFNECHAKTMEMCGCVPVVAALLYAEQKGLKTVDVLKTANSGDVSGDRDRVVGYASMVIYGEKTMQGVDLSLSQKKHLIGIAKDTIQETILNHKTLTLTEFDPRLNAEEGAFVTLHKHGKLRGCIGHIIGQGPLYLTVRDMAIAAATQDPRFQPVSLEELGEIEVEVSVLSKPRKIKHVDEIQLGKHGVIIRQGALHQGVFLPQVANETGWTKEEFLTQLCTQKARLPASCWKDPKTQLEIFTADVFSEKDFL